MVSKADRSQKDYQEKRGLRPAFFLAWLRARILQAPDTSGLDIDQLAPALRFARQRLRAGIDGLAGFGAAGPPARRLAPASRTRGLKSLRLSHASTLKCRGHGRLRRISGSCRSGGVRFRGDRRRRRYVDVHHQHSQARLSECGNHATTSRQCHPLRTRSLQVKRRCASEPYSEQYFAQHATPLMPTRYYPLGCCWVMQWMPPPPLTMSKAGTWITSRSEKTLRRVRNASSSAASSKAGMTMPPLAM
jgi:hypothetical protein